MATVRQLLNGKGSEIYAVAPDATVFDALAEMAERNVGALLVLEGERMAGILSERDYARKVILAGKASRDTLVREIMTSEVISVAPEHTTGDCLRLMTDKRIRHLPVLEDGRVAGIISIGDVVKAKMDEQQVMIGHLEDYIAGNR